MKDSLDTISNYLTKQVTIAPLVVFRIAVGLLLLYSTLRTAQKGWIKELYLDPSYHFYFFEWLKPLEDNGMYVVFILMAISAAGIILGFFYRISSICFFILFTYVELLDITYYLNHYYLVSILTFWLTLVPAHRWYSVDSIMFPKIKTSLCQNWHTLIFKFQLSIVYFFAGLAKVNPDWLLHAQPMATWLPGKYGLPVFGKWMHLKETAFFFSWAGCLYDLFIWIFLWIKKSRKIAYFFVLVFHVMTGILFPRIGMFPYIMITSTLIFFTPTWHKEVLHFLPYSKKFNEANFEKQSIRKEKRWVFAILVTYLVAQLYLPLRHLHYPGNLFWHEQGYRFSWRVMLMEKNGYTSIILKDPKRKTQMEIDQDQYLTPFQQQQMKSQPDMILQFSRYIGDEFRNINGYKPEIYVQSRMSLNGRRGQPFTNEQLDIYSIPDPMKAGWILALK